MNTANRHTFISVITLALIVSSVVSLTQTSVQAGWVNNVVNSIKKEVKNCTSGGCDPIGLIPLTASAQIAPNQIVICSSLSRRATFKLDGKEEALEAKQCRTYSGRSTYLFYTYYLHNPLNGGMQYRRMVPRSLERVLSGGEQYDLQRKQSGYLDIVKKVDIIPKNYLLPARSYTPDVRSPYITLQTVKIFSQF